jgi:hypothetical protein
LPGKLPTKTFSFVRRPVLLAALANFASAFWGRAHAQATWPNRPLIFVVVAGAKPDAYTFLFTGNSVLVIIPLMTRSLPFNVENDLAVAVSPVPYVLLSLQ